MNKVYRELLNKLDESIALAVMLSEFEDSDLHPMEDPAGEISYRIYQLKKILQP